MRESFLPTRATLVCTSPVWWAGEESTVTEIYTEIECVLHFAVGINFLAVLLLMVTFKLEDKRLTPQASPFSGRTLRALLILWIAETCHQKCFCDLKDWTRQDTSNYCLLVLRSSGWIGNPQSSDLQEFELEAFHFFFAGISSFLSNIWALKGWWI